MKSLAVVILILSPHLFTMHKQWNRNENTANTFVQKKQYSSIDAVVQDLYKSLTYEHNKKPEWKNFRQLFIKGARLIHVKGRKYTSMTPDTFAIRFNKQIEDGFLKSFREREVSRKTDSLGHIVHVFSLYRARYWTENGQGKENGVNSIQLIKNDGRWWITSILWDESNSKNPIPPRFLDVLDPKK